jgi:hypothetical protein
MGHRRGGFCFRGGFVGWGLGEGCRRREQGKVGNEMESPAGAVQCVSLIGDCLSFRGHDPAIAAEVVFARIISSLGYRVNCKPV